MKKAPKFALTLMLIKWGALVVDGRGKLGGHVASQNRGGSYLRTKVTPSNPRTSDQTTVRQLFGSISSGWSGLTASALLAWNEAVEDWQRTNIFGDLKKPSGKALYQRLNQQAQIAGYPAIPLPPLKVTMPEFNVISADIAIGDGEIMPQGLYAGTDFTVLTFSSGPVTKGTTFVKNRMRLIDSTNGAVYDPEQAYQGFVDKYGAPVIGEKVYLGFKVVAPTGQASPMQIVDTVVSA